MRDIIFRAKNFHTGEWVYGSLIAMDSEIDCCQVFIFPPINRASALSCSFLIRTEMVAVDAKTIGQYTGLTDKNGKKIFEGDVIKSHYCNAKKADFIEKVVFHNGRFCSLYKMPGAGNGKMWAALPDGVPHIPQDKTAYMEFCEVIGNIHDNPKLLGGAGNGE